MYMLNVVTNGIVFSCNENIDYGTGFDYTTIFRSFSIDDCLTIYYELLIFCNEVCLLGYGTVIPGYGTLNHGDSDRTDDLASVLAFDVSESTLVSVKIAHSIQLIMIAITT